MDAHSACHAYQGKLVCYTLEWERVTRNVLRMNVTSSFLLVFLEGKKEYMPCTFDCFVQAMQSRGV